MYEIGRIFRNEGIWTCHNPEFTTIEVFICHSFHNVDLMTIEIVIQLVCEKCFQPIFDGLFQMYEAYSDYDSMMNTAEEIVNRCALAVDDKLTIEYQVHFLYFL